MGFSAQDGNPQRAGLVSRAPGEERVLAGFLYEGGREGKGYGGGQGKEVVGEFGDKPSVSKVLYYIGLPRVD